MPTDPASVNVSISVTGLSKGEAATALHGCPPGSRFSADITQPALGGKRHHVEVSGLSLRGAHEFVEALLTPMAEALEGDTPDAP